MQVGLDRRDREKELPGNVSVALPLEHLEYDLALPPGDTVLAQEGLEELVDLDRGRDEKAQEVHDDENAVERVRDRTEQEKGDARKTHLPGMRS